MRVTAAYALWRTAHAPEFARPILIERIEALLRYYSSAAAWPAPRPEIT